MNTTPDDSPHTGEWYADHADEYDDVRIDEHYIALEYMTSLMRLHGLHTVLDVGSGTGRAVEYLKCRDFEARGIEPVPEMIKVGATRYGIEPGLILQGKGEALPFPDASFDAVCACGIMHHIVNPDPVVREMLRVSRVAVFISDSNRFGQGSWMWRRVKLLLYRLHLWRLANFVGTGFKGYHIEGGRAYSYSVYDSYQGCPANELW